MRKHRRNRRVWLFFLENLASLATILSGFVVILAQLLGWIQSQATVNAIIVSLLCLFAISEIVQRTGKLERIEEGIAQLLKQRDGSFIRDIDFAFDRANSMVEAVRSGGHIYDTSSIENHPTYEKLIEEKFRKGVRITRIVCSNNARKSLSDFIRFPGAHMSGVDKETFSIHHLPYSLPFDVLITQEGASTHAILGFITSKADNREYSSAFYVANDEFAFELLSLYKHVLIPQAEDHRGKKGEEHYDQCHICEEICRIDAAR
jgi:hypothetical protein